MFGGLAAALCVQAAIDSIPDLPPLRSAQFLFIGPGDGTVHLSASLLRRGKSAVIASAEMSDATGTLVRSHLCFGNARTSTIDYSDLTAPSVEAPELVSPLRSAAWQRRASVLPELRHACRWKGIAVQWREKSGFSDVDAISCRRRRNRRHRAGRRTDRDRRCTAVERRAALQNAGANQHDDLAARHAERNPATADGFWLVRRRLDFARDGYSTETISVWNSEREPVMIARQNVALFT